MYELSPLLPAVLVLGALAILGFAFLKLVDRSTLTITQTERGLLYRHGTFTAVLGPGRYWTLFGRKIVKVGINQRTLLISNQEVLSADRLPVKVTGLATYHVVDPQKSVEASEGGHLNAVYFGAQIAMRNVLAELPVEELIDARTKLDDRLTENARAAFTDQGCRLDSLALRDLVLPAEVRRLATDVTRAKMEAAANLERARGEQATLRLLNNAARLLKGNPELMNLRILQTLAPSPGRPAPTVILGSVPGVVPVQGSPAADTAEAPEIA
jgi:regulator of protease activity HflC (stomatin/prohibitin superfamily)